jgi:hypothetical protein
MMIQVLRKRHAATDELPTDGGRKTWVGDACLTVNGSTIARILAYVVRPTSYPRLRRTVYAAPTVHRRHPPSRAADLTAATIRTKHQSRPTVEGTRCEPRTSRGHVAPSRRSGGAHSGPGGHIRAMLGGGAELKGAGWHPAPTTRAARAGGCDRRNAGGVGHRARRSCLLPIARAEASGAGSGCGEQRDYFGTRCPQNIG